jgi:hypothetical protein
MCYTGDKTETMACWNRDEAEETVPREPSPAPGRRRERLRIEVALT